MKSWSRKAVATFGTLVVGAALLVTGGTAANAASDWEEYGSPNENWRITRTIVATSPKVGDVVTVKAEIQRRYAVANLYRYKDLHPACLTYVPGSAKLDGQAFTPEVVPDDSSMPGMGYVRWSGDVAIWALGSSWQSTKTFTIDYRVTSSCVRETNLPSTAHVSGTLGGDQNFAPSAFNGGPSIQVQKDATSIGLTAAPSSAVVDQAVTFTANTTGIGDGQTVTIGGDGTGVGSATVSGNKATFTRSFGSTGTKNVSVSYAGSSIAHPAGPATATVEISRIPSTIVLEVGTPTHIGTAVPLIATTTGIPDGQDIEFFVGGVKQQDTAKVEGGKATFTGWVPATADDYTVYARYAGSSTVNEATSGNVGVTVTDPTQLTSTSLAVDPAPVPGVASTLTATVTDGKDGDTVEFALNGQPLVPTATLDNGVAGIQWTPTPGQANQPYSLTARYVGSPGYAASTSSPVTGTVGLVQTTVSLVGAPSTATVGTPVELAATVTGGAAGQPITFRNGGNVLCTVSLSASGTVKCPWTPQATGVYEVTAHYPGTATTSEASSASATTVTVGAKQSSITLTGPASARVGEVVTLTAGVTGIADGEDVTFQIEGESDRTAQVAGGQATLQWTPSTTGTRQLRAVYAGSGTVSGSQSNAISVAVGPAQTQTAAVAASANPVTGAPVTLSTTVTGGREGVAVAFRDAGGTTLCSATLRADGTVSCEWIPDTIGNVAVTAHYAGNDVTEESSSPSATTVTVGQGVVSAPSDLVVAPLNPDADDVVTVSGTAPRGSVVTVFTPNFAQQCEATVSAQGTFSCDLGALPIGTNSISAVAEMNGESSQPTSTTVTVVKVAPTLALTGPASVRPGQAATLQLATTGIADAQKVDILVDGALHGQATVTGGTATYPWTPAVAGSYTVRARYAGSGSVEGGMSNPLTITVDALFTSTSNVVASPSAVPVGGTVRLSATVTGGTQGATVQFRNGATVLCPATVQGDGTASCDWVTTAVGSVDVVAHYLGEPGVTNASSSGQATRIEVGKAATSTSGVTAGPAATVGVAVPLTATVTGGVKDVTVEFRNGTATLCTGALPAGGTVSCDWTPTAPGPVSVTAHYLGDASTAASNSATGTAVTVAPAPDTEAPAAPTGITIQPQPATAGQTVTVTGTAEAGSTVSVMVDGTKVCDATATGGTFSCSFQVTEQMDGKSVTATATDAANNTSGAADGGTLRVDPAAVEPTVPTITVTPAQPVAGEKVQIEVTGDAGEVVVVTNGDAEICRVTLGQDGTATCEWTPNAAGQVTLKVTAGDQTVEETVTVRPADDGGDDDDDAGMGSLGSLFGGAGGTGSSGSLSSLGG